jgi:hypothetical protein
LDINQKIVRKRTGIILLFLFAAVLAVAAFFIRRDKQVVVLDPWVVVPSDAFFITETNDFPELLTMITDPAGLMSRLSPMRWAASLLHTVSVIDSITGGREVRELISNRKTIISLHVAGQGHVTPLLVMNSGTSLTSRRFVNLCELSGGRVTDARDLGGTKTYTVTYGRGDKQTPLYIALTAGTVVISTSESLLSAALDNESSGSDIRLQQGFTKVVSSAGKEADNVYILFRNLPGFVKSFMTPVQVTAVTTVAIAGGGDLTSTEEGLFISGFLSTIGAGAGADRLKDVEPAECGVQEVLPQGTFSYRTIMHRASLKGETATDPASINATDLALILSPFTGSEVTEALVPVSGGEERVIIFRMTDQRSAESVLYERLLARYRSVGLRESHFVASASGGGDSDDAVLYRMPFTGVASVLAGEGRSKAGDGWVTFARSYMIFSGSPEALAIIRRESDSENTLINDPDFREMEKTLPTKSSYLFYASGGILRSLLSPILAPGAEATLTDRSFSGIGGVGISLTPSNDMIYTSISVRYNDAGDNAIRTTAGTAPGIIQVSDTSALRLVWKVRLDAEPACVPFLFTNHNTGATEIFIQDQRNNIYLISASGKILWKAMIRERITGDIFMIDYYKNGKNQLLFTGHNYIHLIDRNGNYVDKYPVKMRSPASNTLAVFDYESNKDYRLFISGEDNKIYVYDRSGTPVRGWNIFTTRGRVQDPVEFFRVRGKDYLFAADDQAVYVLDRTGNIRVAHQEPLRKAAGSAARLTAGDEQSVIFSAPDGTVIYLLFDGTVKKESPGVFSAGHLADFTDLDGDNNTDYICIDHGVLHAFGSSKEELYSYSFETENLGSPVIFTVSPAEKRIAVYEKDRQMLHLLGRAGHSLTGFPRKAGPYFNLGRVTNKSTWNLLVNENDAYLYNYELTSGSKQ